jgi:hypothetical protein
MPKLHSLQCSGAQGLRVPSSGDFTSEQVSWVSDSVHVRTRESRSVGMRRCLQPVHRTHRYALRATNMKSIQPSLTATKGGTRGDKGGTSGSSYSNGSIPRMANTMSATPTIAASADDTSCRHEQRVALARHGLCDVPVRGSEHAHGENGRGGKTPADTPWT